MLKQFFDKPFWIILAALSGVFALAVAAFQTPMTAPLLAIAGIGAFALAVRRLEYGLVAAFAELFANSHGHLISADIAGQSVSLRMAVFAGVMIGWGVALALRRIDRPRIDQRALPFLAILAAAGFGFLIGLPAHGAAAFADGNGYLFVLYALPMLSVAWTPDTRRLLLQALAAGAAWVCLLSLGLFFVFSHVPEFLLADVYTFIRDTRTGELTKMLDGIFRVFLQAQISIALFVLILAPLFWVDQLRTRQRLVLTGIFSVLVSVIFLSLSRSFWVGFAAAGLVHMPLAWLYVSRNWKGAARAVGGIALSKIFAVVVLAGVLVFPWPRVEGAGVGDFTSLFASRATQTTDAAIDSRWKLLDPMLEMVAQRPMSGYGFGQTVSFITDDPRIRAERPDGHWETFSLEWGWLELWLKMGIIGPFAFLFALHWILRGLAPYLREERAWLGVGLITAVLFVYATHAFSPYLNHPLGIGMLLFTIPFLRVPAERKDARIARVPRENAPVRPAPAAPSALSTRD